MKSLEINGLGRVGRIGLGTWQFGSREWGYGEGYASQTARGIVRRALELGVNFFDTAEIYGFGRSESILAEALGEDRHQVLTASKLFPVAPFAPVIRRRAAGSARRLQLERMPLYQVHWPNPVVPDSVIMPELRRLRDEHLIGQVGVSNYTLARWQEADRALRGSGGVDVAPVISNQVQFSLAHPQPLDELVPFAEREGRMLIAYSPLAMGLLGGRYDEHNRPGGMRATNRLFSTETLRRAAPLLGILREVAAAHDARPAQVALAWLISFPGVVVIPGASSIEQLEFNVASAELDLAPDEQAALTGAAQAFTPQSRQEALVDQVRQRVGQVRQRVGSLRK